MATFVDAHGSRDFRYPRINLDLVAKLCPVKGATGDLVAYRCETTTGETLGTIDPAVVPDAGGIVPETRGTILIAFHRWVDGAAPVAVFRHPVVAWRVEGDTAVPIIADELPKLYCLEHSPAESRTVSGRNGATTRRKSRGLGAMWGGRHDDTRMRVAAGVARQ